jgi:hypothetical protein
VAENYDGHLPQALAFMAYLSVPTNIVILSSKYDVVLLNYMIFPMTTGLQI